MIPNPVFERLTELATCLCGQINDPVNDVPGVCFCGVIPGNAIPAEYTGDCGDVCGAAWVRLVSLYQSNSVGVMNTLPANCDSALGIDIEVGIVRCISVGDEMGNPPSPEELLEAAELQVADALILWKAILCCDEVPPGEVVIGQYQPIGPEGGLVGGSFLLSMGL